MGTEFERTQTTDIEPLTQTARELGEAFARRRRDGAVAVAVAVVSDSLAEIGAATKRLLG